MGASRINDLPERALTQTLIEARRDMAGLKGAPQRISGANLTYFAGDLPTGFDWSGQLSTAHPATGRGYAGFTITLTSKTAVVPVTDLAIIVYHSTDGGVTWNEYSQSQGLSDTYNGIAPEISRFLTVLQGTEVEAFTAKYSFLLYGVLNTRVAFRVQAFSTDEVTVSVTRTV